MRLRRLLRREPAVSRRSYFTCVRSVAEASATLAGLQPGDMPVAAGGDGTVSLVATALWKRGLLGIPMAVVPLGTGNIVARELGLADPRLALRALEQGVVRRVDVMRTSHPSAPLALVSVSGGFEGRFLARYARLRRYGRPLAALGALTAAWQSGAACTLECEGETVLHAAETAFSAGLYNTRYYAAGLAMLPEADIADGRGEACVYRTARGYRAALVAAGRGRAPSVRHRAWTSARIESQGPLQIDGEPVSGGVVRVWIEARSLALIVPAAE